MYEQNSVDELRAAIRNAGFKDEIKGKKNLVKFMQENNITLKQSNIFDEVELESNSPIEMTEEDLKQEEEKRQNWDDFLLSQLGEDEIDDNGYPLLPGLRRLTKENIGEVIFSGPVSINYNISEGRPHATCLYEIQILWLKDVEPHAMDSAVVKTFRAAADCHPGNTDGAWSNFATAIAEARAESRAYRKILELKTITGEEAANSAMKPPEDEITKNQLKVINLKIEKLGLRHDFIEFYTGKPINKCDKKDGAKLIRVINQYQSNLDNIPQEAKR